MIEPKDVPFEATGPATLAEVMDEVDRQAIDGNGERLRPVPTGFTPLDDVLNGGLRPGELTILGGPFGVGKTIWALQLARNVAAAGSGARALYICYEHDRTHLLSRLLCLESAERGYRDDALTLKKIADLAGRTVHGGQEGPIARLRSAPRYASLMQAVGAYAERLVLAKASGDKTGLEQLASWTRDEVAAGGSRLVVVVDYLQKIPVRGAAAESEGETTTYLTHGLKEMAMGTGVAVVAIAAADREGLKSKRMRLSDLRGSSAMQYEADIGLVLNNKHAIMSREQMVYNPAQAEAMRERLVLSVEKNRAGRSGVDMEHQLDAAHFRIAPKGDFVRDRLIDERAVLE